jgi:hypothetical protein
MDVVEAIGHVAKASARCRDCVDPASEGSRLSSQQGPPYPKGLTKASYRRGASRLLGLIASSFSVRPDIIDP